ncbi:DUF7577 domain-containing protein [Natronomonas salina]|uniref:DUF7577 domain-containing protein n=1 Tax=Natronomonas salina TaxID=1710540 RepID=UPI003CCD5A5A
MSSRSHRPSCAAVNEPAYQFCRECVGELQDGTPTVPVQLASDGLMFQLVNCSVGRWSEESYPWLIDAFNSVKTTSSLSDCLVPPPITVNIARADSIRKSSPNSTIRNVLGTIIDSRNSQNHR